jgi:fused signal recognition particle receptor
MGFLDKIGFTKLKEGLTKTREGIVGKVTRLITARSKIDDVTLEEVEEILIGADVGLDGTLRGYIRVE